MQRTHVRACVPVAWPRTIRRGYRGNKGSPTEKKRNEKVCKNKRGGREAETRNERRNQELGDSDGREGKGDLNGRVGNTGKTAHQVGSVSGGAGDANERKDSGNDAAKVDEEEVGGGRRRTLAEEQQEEEQEGVAEEGEQAGAEWLRREGRVEGQQSRGNLISACGGF